MTNPSPNPRWTREQIRAARQVPLLPLLQKRGLQLIEREAGNYALADYQGLIVKESYWRSTREISDQTHPPDDGQNISWVWPERNQAGNTIDFYTKVLGLSFHQAMRQITGDTQAKS